MFGIGPLELVVILVVALLVFGPKRVPELARTVGRGLAEFRRASSDLRQTLALDELERDLRRDLSGNQTIQRPENRPAQAVDGVDSGKPTDETPSEVTTEPPHPGELPLGNDHEHHDESDDADSNSDGETHSNIPADSDLGNVPVSGSKPADPRRG